MMRSEEAFGESVLRDMKKVKNGSLPANPKSNKTNICILLFTFHDLHLRHSICDICTQLLLFSSVVIKVFWYLCVLLPPKNHSK